MSFSLQPWQLYVAIIAGWIHRQQQEANTFAPRTGFLGISTARNAFCSTTTRDADWQLRARFSVATDSKRLARFSRPIRFSAGIEPWLPRNGTTANGANPWDAHV